MALIVNIFLMIVRNIVFEMRQRAVTLKINKKIVENLWISRKFKKYVPIFWAECKPGHIIRVTSGQEFPADCLILDIAGVSG
jgi:magnesium-transporting ATPase (P-type)